MDAFSSKYKRNIGNRLVVSSRRGDSRIARTVEDMLTTRFKRTLSDL